MDSESTFQVYSPSSVIGIFSNALKINATVNLIYLKGRYSYGAGKAYGNFYYDLLYSEGDHMSIGIRISSLLRSKIVNNEIYTLKGYIEKSIKNSSIELRFVVDEIIQQEEKSISEEELQRYELIQKKLEMGSKDIETLIRDKMLRSEVIRVANIYGNGAIVQKDFREGLDVSDQIFNILDFNCNITSASAIISTLEEIALLDFDIIALVRGGGDKQSMETFNNLALSEVFIGMKSVMVTAIGHTVDETLLDKLADKRFHLPHDYGAGLHSIAEKLSSEKSNSRALLIDEVKKDVTKQFSEQVTTLNQQLSKKNEEFEKLQEGSTKQLENLQNNFKEQQKKREAEMESYKKEISALHDKNVQSAINEHTAILKANLENARLDNQKLSEKLRSSKTDYSKLVLVFLLALVFGFVIAKIF